MGVRQDEKEAGSWQEDQCFVLGSQGKKFTHIMGEPDKSSLKATDARCPAFIRIRVPLQKIPLKKTSANRKLNLLVQSNDK